MTVAGVKQDWATLAQFADLPKKACARAGLLSRLSAGALAEGTRQPWALPSANTLKMGPACAAPSLSCMHLAPTTLRRRKARTKNGRS